MFPPRKGGRTGSINCLAGILAGSHQYAVFNAKVIFVCTVRCCTFYLKWLLFVFVVKLNSADDCCSNFAIGEAVEVH